mmetsp:Transcript_103704/g.199084  ORF Transcript_103704/g.199084 Transcript_103704/m.199084 type:complete len:237 (+) Transcript_103704:298-1008(+)
MKTKGFQEQAKVGGRMLQKTKKRLNKRRSQSWRRRDGRRRRLAVQSVSAVELRRRQQPRLQQQRSLQLPVTLVKMKLQQKLLLRDLQKIRRRKRRRGRARVTSLQLMLTRSGPWRSCLQAILPALVRKPLSEKKMLPPRRRRPRPRLEQSRGQRRSLQQRRSLKKPPRQSLRKSLPRSLRQSLRRRRKKMSKVAVRVPCRSRSRSVRGTATRRATGSIVRRSEARAVNEARAESAP